MAERADSGFDPQADIGRTEISQCSGTPAPPVDPQCIDLDQGSAAPPVHSSNMPFLSSVISTVGRERYMRRRDFVSALASAAAWSSVVRAQQIERGRRVGVLTTLAAGDME